MNKESILSSRTSKMIRDLVLMYVLVLKLISEFADYLSCTC
jgi:hypothetical protein